MFHGVSLTLDFKANAFTVTALPQTYTSNKAKCTCSPSVLAWLSLHRQMALPAQAIQNCGYGN